MRIFDKGLPLLALTSYLNAAALAVLGLLTVIIALFKHNPNAQAGGGGVIIVAVLLAAATATVMHTHRRSTR